MTKLTLHQTTLLQQVTESRDIEREVISNIDEAAREWKRARLSQFVRTTDNRIRLAFTSGANKQKIGEALQTKNMLTVNERLARTAASVSTTSASAARTDQDATS